MLLHLRKVSATYLYFFFQSKTSYLQEVVAPGNGQPNLNTELIGGIPVPIPSKQEQEVITGVLNTWDKAITATEKLLANSRKQKQFLMQRLFTTSTQKLHSSEIFSTNSVRQNGGLELLSVMQDVGVIPRRLLDRKVVMPDGSTEAYKLVEPGNFVISLRSFEGGLE